MMYDPKTSNIAFTVLKLQEFQIVRQFTKSIKIYIFLTWQSGQLLDCIFPINVNQCIDVTHFLNESIYTELRPNFTRSFWNYIHICRGSGRGLCSPRVKTFRLEHRISSTALIDACNFNLPLMVVGHNSLRTWGKRNAFPCNFFISSFLHSIIFLYILCRSSEQPPMWTTMLIFWCTRWNVKQKYRSKSLKEQAIKWQTHHMYCISKYHILWKRVSREYVAISEEQLVKHWLFIFLNLNKKKFRIYWESRVCLRLYCIFCYVQKNVWGYTRIRM